MLCQDTMDRFPFHESKTHCSHCQNEIQIKFRCKYAGQKSSLSSKVLGSSAANHMSEEVLDAGHDCDISEEPRQGLQEYLEIRSKFAKPFEEFDPNEAAQEDGPQ